MLRILSVVSVAFLVGCSLPKSDLLHTHRPAAPALESPPDPVPTGAGGALGPAREIPTEPLTITTLGAPLMRFEWPLDATGVTSLFGKRTDPLDGSQRFHYGVDLEADYGSIVRAVAPGVVRNSGWMGAHGRQITLEHPGGFASRYAHLAQVIVPTGVDVVAGQAIGLVGNSGRSTGPHLHLELTRNGVYLDPLDFLGSEVTLPR